jgi:hypothetical protein
MSRGVSLGRKGPYRAVAVVAAVVVAAAAEAIRITVGFDGGKVKKNARGSMAVCLELILSVV